MKRTTPVRLLCLLACLLLAGALSGCTTSDPRPLSNPVPEVVWPEGEPDGPLESDPWVQALREYAVLTGAAQLSFNYSDPALQDVMSEEYLLRWYPASMQSTWTPLGPVTFVPVEVKSTSPTTADVVVCTGYMHESIDDKPYMRFPSNGYASVYQMELGTDGFRRVYNIGAQQNVVGLPGSFDEGRTGPCNSTGWEDLIKPALFTPAVDTQAWHEKLLGARRYGPPFYDLLITDMVPPVGVEWVDPDSLEGKWRVSWTQHKGWWSLGFIVIGTAVITASVVGGVHMSDRRRASPPKGRAGVTGDGGLGGLPQVSTTKPV